MPIIRLIVIVPSREISIEYLSLFLSALSENGSGTSTQQLTVPTIKPKLVALPPLNEQKRIANVYENAKTIIKTIENEKSEITNFCYFAKKKILDQVFQENSSYKSYYGARIKTTLKELINPNNIGDGDWVLSENMTENGDYNLIQLKHIGFGKYLDKSYKSVDNNFFKINSCTEIKKGYILINRLIADEMNVCILPKLRFKTITAVDVCWIAPNENYNQKYLMYYLLSPQFQKEVLMNGSGTTRKRISKNNLIKLPLFLHERANQELIVSKIEKSFEVLDNITK